MGLLANRFGANFDTVDTNIATNLREHREARDLSQDELATAMTDRGFGFTQSTIWKIEQGKRPVKASELVALADSLNILSWTTMLNRPDEARHQRDVEMLHLRTGRAYENLKEAAIDFLSAQLELAGAAHQARDAGVAIAELWTSWLGIPAERAVIEARIEDERDEPIRLQLIDAVDQVIDALRERGYTPIIDLDDIETHGPDTDRADPRPVPPATP